MADQACHRLGEPANLPRELRHPSFQSNIRTAMRVVLERRPERAERLIDRSARFRDRRFENRNLALGIDHLAFEAQKLDLWHRARFVELARHLRS